MTASSETATGGRVVIIHEWLTNYAGSERVVDALRSLRPDTPIVTTLKYGSPFDVWKVRTSLLQVFARSLRSHVGVLPLMPLAWRITRIPPADTNITVFHSFSLYARVPKRCRRIVYCCTPPRFLYRPEGVRGRLGIVKRALLAIVAHPLRLIDQQLARRPGLIWLADSEHIARKIHETYGLRATVVYPPVELRRFDHNIAPKGDFFLCAGRLVDYKRPDIAVRAFSTLGVPLYVAGDGPLLPKLKHIAAGNIRFLGQVSDEEMASLMSRALAVVFPGEEDFGIVPVEAIAAGTPVIALASGGALETVKDGTTGVLFEGDSPAALCDAVGRFQMLNFDRATCRAQAEKFSLSAFHDAMRSIVGTDDLATR